ncbi:MAG: ATP-binding protein, partial [Verrucomicrobiae bacterium]|nr:ATP-binding protein [Verrucomicrobiae bacterium]
GAGILFFVNLVWEWHRQKVAATMQRALRRASEGDLRVRVPRSGWADGQPLVDEVNELLATWEARWREMASTNRELQATLANMTEGVLVVNADGVIRLANRAIQEQLNVSGPLEGRSVLEVFRNTELQALVSEALSRGQVTARELTLQGTEQRVFEVNAVCLRDESGTCRGAVIVMHDITRINALENMRKDFVANVSHELRTPLSIIKGYVETLLEEPRPDPETAATFLQTIRRHSNRLETLIGDLLTISALESQDKRLTLGRVSLRAVAEAARDELAPQAAAKQTRFSIEIPVQFPEARADATRLHQVFVNLFDNAIKYTPPGSQVVVTAVERDEELEVCVADNGPGIAAEHLDRIFERFYRVDKARSRDLGGTGLGLSIVKHIIQVHNGRVWAESELGKGSRFYFTLPRP